MQNRRISGIPKSESAPMPLPWLKDWVVDSPSVRYGWKIHAHLYLFRVVMARPLADPPLAVSAAHAVLDVIEKEDLTARAKQLGNFLLQEIQQLAEKFPQQILEVRGRGLMLGIQLTDEPSELLSILRENGLLAVGAAGQTLRLLPH